VTIHSGKRTAARGDHGQKRLSELVRRSQGRFKIPYVALDCGMTSIFDGTGTGKKADNICVLGFLAGGKIRHPGGSFNLVVSTLETPKLCVAEIEPIRLGFGRGLKSRESFPHVSHPTALPQFAIARNVDSDLALLSDYLSDALAQIIRKCVTLEGLAHRLRAHCIDYGRRFHKASDMGR
jgi:hypothetical protein